MPSPYLSLRSIRGENCCDSRVKGSERSNGKLSVPLSLTRVGDRQVPPASPRCQASLADCALRVEARPDYRGAARHHRAIYLDVGLIATDSCYAIVTGARLVALKSLAAGQFGQFCRCGCASGSWAGMTGTARLIRLPRSHGMKPKAGSVCTTQRVTVSDRRYATRKPRRPRGCVFPEYRGARPEEHRYADADDEYRGQHQRDRITSRRQAASRILLRSGAIVGAGPVRFPFPLIIWRVAFSGKCIPSTPVKTCLGGKPRGTSSARERSPLGGFVPGICLISTRSPNFSANGTLRSVRFVTVNCDKRSFTRHFNASNASRTAESLIATARPMTDGILAGSRLGRR